MQASAPTDAGLPNYDTDRDAKPGLLVQKSGAGLSETGSTKRQRWATPVAAGLTLGGPAAVDLRVAVKDLETTKGGQVLAMLQDCSGAHTGCTVVATGAVTFSQTAFGAAFGPVHIDFGTINRTIGAGRSLVLTLVTGDGVPGGDDLWYAFGTSTHPSRLTLTT